MKDQILWTALITPMNRDLTIQFDDLKKICRLQEQAGNGILLLGSTGEGLALNGSEKKSVVEFVTNLKLKIPVMIGVGGFNLKDQQNWIKWCNQKPVDAFLMVMPLYAKPGQIGQIEWFRSLLQVSEKPGMIYNIPSRTGMKLLPGVLPALQNEEMLWAVKEASGSLSDFRSFREEVPDLPLYSGDDGLITVFATMGAKGLVSVASNVWPHQTRKYVNISLTGKKEVTFPVWNRAVDALFSASNPIPVKRLLYEKELIENPCVRPPLYDIELKNSDELLNADNEINTWYKMNN